MPGSTPITKPSAIASSRNEKLLAAISANAYTATSWRHLRRVIAYLEYSDKGDSSSHPS